MVLLGLPSRDRRNFLTSPVTSGLFSRYSPKSFMPKVCLNFLNPVRYTFLVLKDLNSCNHSANSESKIGCLLGEILVSS